jgi:hypothetical protein
MRRRVAERSSMTSSAIPELPPYRITLFFGPEPVNGRPACLSCVFNVKKRSWKGGIQVDVRLDETQVARARRTLGFEGWLDAALAVVSERDREVYRHRADDLLAQGLCARKLDLAIEEGLTQENQVLEEQHYVSELDDAVGRSADLLKAQILTELDLAT